MRRLIALFLLLVPARAWANDAGVCDPPVEVGPLEVTPAVGASSVPRDGIVKVRYSPGYFVGGTTPTETITLSPAVAGRLELAGDDTLYFVPSALLPPNTAFTGTASGGAFPFDFRFTTSGATDGAPPILPNPNGSSDLAVDSSAIADGCAPAGSRRIRVTFPSVIESGAPSTSVEYSLYVTRGEGLDAPRLVSRVRDFGAPVTTVGFVLEPPLADRPVCVVAVAQDGADRRAAWAEPVCFDPANGFGFVPLCAAAPWRRSTPSPLSAGLASAMILRLAIRARRNRRR